MKKDEFPLIYEVEVTQDNVVSLLHREIIRLMYTHGSRVKDSLFALALGPNGFKAFEHWARSICTFSCDRDKDGMTFEGIKIVCGPLPFIVPLFREDGWHYAHEDAKRLINETGGVDS